MSKLEILNNINDLIFLRNLYDRHSLNTIHGFYTVNNFVQWFHSNPEIDHVKVFVLSNWRESGVFIIEDRYQLFINSLVSNVKDVAIALKLFDWSRSYKITALPAFLITVVQQTLLELNLSVRIGTLQTYQADAKDILKQETSCPDSLDLRHLSIPDANKINEMWYSQQDGSLENFKTLIAYNICMGLYAKGSNELIAWCTRCQCGFLGTLHVVENYRGQGLASVLINAVSRKIIESGENARVMIHESNKISQNLFTKLGFKHDENVHIVYCEPTLDNISK